ncbi:FkbM family methyltransferase [Rhodohalobacter sp. 8-1]|uniref:FkbM family methyltransferase n=1 Tax=Rhodohalobacter sp. 8-1 TaxID=3131972 RepID=UPI0030EB39D1
MTVFHKVKKTWIETGPIGLLKSTASSVNDRIKILGNRLHRWFFYTNWPAGKLVEWRGNKGFIGGMEFDLSNPHIATFLKGRFLFNTFEPGTHELIRKYLNPDLPVVEIGGCIGVSACLSNRKLRNSQNHIVVEAQPNMLETLRKNRNTNQCDFEIIHAALAYGTDEVDFWISPRYFIGSSLKAREGGKTVSVPTITLEKIIKDNNFSRISLLVDIEGAETELIKHEFKLMEQHVDTLIIEFHPQEWGAGADAIRKTKEQLKNSGFRMIERLYGDHVYKNNRFS